MHGMLEFWPQTLLGHWNFGKMACSPASDTEPFREQNNAKENAMAGPTHGSGMLKPIPPLHDVDLRLLRVFLAVVRNGGFAAAQMDLNIAQSSISDSVSRLEDRFGVVLCNRGRAGFSLTNEGAALFEATRHLFDDIETFRNRISDVRNEVTGTLHLGIVDGIASIDGLSLIDALATLQRKAPMIDLEMKVDTPQALIGGVQDGAFDAAVIPIFRTIPGIETIALTPLVRQVLYCGKGHPFFDLPDAEISGDMLAAAPFAQRKHMEGWTPPEGIQFSPRAWSNDMECLATLVLTGRYIAYLPEPLAQIWVDSGKIRALRTDDLSYSAELFFITRRADLTQATRLLRDALLAITGPG